MPEDTKQDPAKEVRQMLTGINEAWIAGRWSELAEYFHEDMVISKPGQERRGCGKQACLDSYKSFVDRAVVRGFEASDHQIDVWDDTAVASYRFEISYQMNGQDHRDTGIELYVFIHQYGRWLAIWRTLIPQPAAK